MGLKLQLQCSTYFDYKQRYIYIKAHTVRTLGGGCKLIDEVNYVYLPNYNMNVIK